MQVAFRKPAIFLLTLLTTLCLLTLHHYHTSLILHSLPSSPCLDISNVEQLIDLLNSSSLSDKPKCYGDVKKILDSLYKIEVSQDSVVIPQSMEQLVRNKWFQGNERLYEKFQRPVVMTITNRFTAHTSTVNPLRALRPKPPGNGEALERIKNMIEESREGCNFCTDKQTLQDTFGRVVMEKAHIFTAENAFRFYDYTGMVIPADIHDFMDIGPQTFESMITYNAITWFGNIHERHPEKTHPAMIWDVLGKAGASQVHPHIQMFAGTGYYPGGMGLVEKAANEFRASTGSDYLETVVELHIALGLGFRHKTAAIIVPINPTKDREVWVIGFGTVVDWNWLHYVAYRSYIDELQVYCFSQAMALPTAEIADVAPLDSAGSLMLTKMGARGDCTSPYNDVSSLELYLISSISTDYYETIAAIHRTYEKFRIKHPGKYGKV